MSPYHPQFVLFVTRCIAQILVLLNCVVFSSTVNYYGIVMSMSRDILRVRVVWFPADGHTQRMIGI